MANLIFFSSGFLSVIIQTLLLREMLVVFQGNELTIGLIFAQWLLGVSLGSYLAGLVPLQLRENSRYLLLTSFLFIGSFFAVELFAVRNLRNIMGLFHGEGISLLNTVWASFAVIFPVSFFIGAQFNLSVNWLNQEKDGPSFILIYFWESMGYLFGGIFFTYILINYFNSFSIVYLALGLCLTTAFFLAGTKKTRALFTVSVLLYLLLLPVAPHYLEVISLAKLYRGFDLKETRNSPYGQLAVLEKNGEKNFLCDGITQFTLPNEDTSASEEFSYLPLLFHKGPKNTLLIGGWGKYLKEILKYPGVFLDYCELDPDYIAILNKNWPGNMNNELRNKNLRIYYTDGRSFLRKEEKKYDVIFLGLDYPGTLALNRYFTYEFFCLAREKLNPDGILAIKLPGSMVYIDSYLRGLLSCIKNTLENVFYAVKVIPGETSILLSFKNSPAKEEVNKHFLESKLDTKFLSAPYLDYKLDPGKESWLKEELKDTAGPGSKLKNMNYDSHPRGIVFSMLYWQSIFAPAFSKMYLLLVKYSWVLWVLLGIAFLNNRTGVSGTAFTSGFAGMGLQMISVFGLQVYYGNIYHFIGLLSAMFMAGIVFGSGMNAKKEDGKIVDELLKIEWIFCFWIVLCYFLFKFLVLKGAVFFIFSIGSGALLGFELPLLILAKKQFDGISETKASGTIYASDVFGGFFAALSIGCLILPAWGLGKTFIFLLLLKIMSLKWWIILSGPSRVIL
ncbi:MAG: hypothetical protein LHV68_04460 [Elusimicrobia bacterium]|nr:hypothetical protein [Candidatus Liberimonas magnetica]